MAISFQQTEFLRSAASEAQFVRDGLPQITFAGRSNVGKSSVINRVAGRKNLAYVGATPGKTAQINYFRVGTQAYLVDLPGYGYAKVSKEERARWGALMETYFQSPQAISLGVLIVDARHAPTADDVTMYRFFRDAGIPTLILANKTDKLKPREIPQQLLLIRETLQAEEEAEIIPFSAASGAGKDRLLQRLVAACDKKTKKG